LSRSRVSKSEILEVNTNVLRRSNGLIIHPGRSLSMIGTSLMTSNPDIPEAHVLRGWYDSTGNEQSFQAHTRSDGPSGMGGGFKRSELKSLAEAKGIELADTPIYFSTQASLVHIKSDNMSYPACSTPNCNKKVIEDGGQWRCDKCSVVHASPNYR
jgi:replication factor A1